MLLGPNKFKRNGDWGTITRVSTYTFNYANIKKWVKIALIFKTNLVTQYFQQHFKLLGLNSKRLVYFGNDLKTNE